MSAPYLFSLLRFVPDPMRGEFVNLGAIIGNEDTEEWHVQLIDNRKRARKIDSNDSLGMVLARINSIERQIDEYLESIDDLVTPPTEINRSWLDGLHTDHQNQLQVSSPQPIFVQSAADAVRVIEEEFLVDPETTSSSQDRIGKSTGKARLRDALREGGLKKNEDFFERPKIKAGSYDWNFDFIVANGRAVQASQVWSF
jgi:hypothetical protein